MNCDHAAAAIDRDLSAIGDDARAVAGADDAGHGVLARFDGRVGENTAGIRDNRPGNCEERSPGRRGERADEDVALLQALSIGEVEHYHCPSSGDTTAGPGTAHLAGTFNGILRHTHEVAHHRVAAKLLAVHG